MAQMQTPSQVKVGFDTGASGDKVEYPDPSASPLGTDSEAGGTRAADGEAGVPRGLEAQAAAGRKADDSRKRSAQSNPMGLPILVAVLAAVVLGAVLWFSLT